MCQYVLGTIAMCGSPGWSGERLSTRDSAIALHALDACRSSTLGPKTIDENAILR